MKSFYAVLILMLSFTFIFGQYDQNRKVTFTSMEQALQENPLRVYHLDLSQQNLKTFPKEILRFENLVYLSLAHNEITSLSDLDFRSLRQLKEIDLYDNKLEVFPYATFKSARNLIFIDLGENKLKELNSDLNKIRFIEELNLSGNRITSIAEDIRLPFLKILSIERNYLNKFPGFISQSPKLESLNIYGNNIEVIPNEIKALSKLKFLNIGDNPLQVIGEAIVLRKLRTLILDWVDLAKPLDLTFLSKSTLLETLSMEHCNLRSIPEEVYTLRRLKEFSILNNDLKKIDHNIIRNKKLTKLWVGGNNIQEADLATLKDQLKNTTIIEGSKD